MSGVISNVTLASGVRKATHLLGVRGGTWLAEVNERGRIQPRDGSPALDWYIAADDRWHDPSIESTVRQQRRAGVPVIETRLRVPSGDVVQRVWAVADGFIAAEFTNSSSMPVAVALSRGDVQCVRTPSPLGPQGIDLPKGSVVFPIAHGASLTVALPMTSGAIVDWHAVPSPDDMQRTWLAAVERAGYAIVPDKSLSPRINTVRSDLLACSAFAVEDWGTHLAGDDVAIALSLLELVRMGEHIASWRHGDDVLERLAESTTALLREHKKSDVLPWDVERALFAAQWVFRSSGDERAARDVLASHERLARASAPSNQAPDGVRLGAWLDEQLVSPQRDGSVAILGHGIPTMWRGVNFECHDIVMGAESTLSFAVRWHGEHPALLWEVSGAEGTRLTTGATDPEWSSTAMSGETLLRGATR